MTQPNQLEPAIVLERFINIQREVTRDAEDLADAVAPQLVEQESAQKDGS